MGRDGQTLIDDDILEEFAIVAEPGAVVDKLLARYAGLFDAVLSTFDTGSSNSERKAITELQNAA